MNNQIVTKQYLIQYVWGFNSSKFKITNGGTKLLQCQFPLEDSLEAETVAFEKALNIFQCELAEELNEQINSHQMVRRLDYEVDGKEGTHFVLEGAIASFQLFEVVSTKVMMPYDGDTEEELPPHLLEELKRTCPATYHKLYGLQYPGES